MRIRPDDLVALQWDEACRDWSTSLLDACDSPRLLDLHRKFFDQSRRFRLALLREGHLDFANRKALRQQLLESVLERDTASATRLMEQEISAELTAKQQKNERS